MGRKTQTFSGRIFGMGLLLFATHRKLQAFLFCKAQRTPFDLREAIHLRVPGHAVPQLPAQMEWSAPSTELTVQAGDMAGTLQHAVRALTARASSTEELPRGQADELPRLRDELHQLRQSNLKRSRCRRIKRSRLTPFSTSGSLVDKKHRALRSALGTIQKTLFVVNLLQ